MEDPLLGQSTDIEQIIMNTTRDEEYRKMKKLDYLAAIMFIKEGHCQIKFRREDDDFGELQNEFLAFLSTMMYSKQPDQEHYFPSLTFSRKE